MRCEQICVENFRNIEKASLTFGPGVNVLIGNNAQGKTNLLEAIYYTALGRSFRQAHDGDMLRFGSAYACLSNDFSDSLRRQNITMRFTGDRRRRHVEQNRVRIEKMSDVVGVFRVVLFCPEHLSLIKDGPGIRRGFMDVALSQLYPLYLQSLQRASQILKQRGKLLRDAASDRSVFEKTGEFWSLQFARECALISSYRAAYIRKISGYVAEIFGEMTDQKEIPQIVYRSSSGLAAEEIEDTGRVEKKYISLLTTRTDREIFAGATLWGIHRDDMEILLNGNPARIFASQGQQRSLALALKLSEGEICREKCGGDYPVFLLDDVLSELDAERQSYLLCRTGGKQVIMTTCDFGAAENKNIPDAHLIRVENGCYTEVKEGTGCVSARWQQ